MRTPKHGHPGLLLMIASLLACSRTSPPDKGGAQTAAAPPASVAPGAPQTKTPDLMTAARAYVAANAQPGVQFTLEPHAESPGFALLLAVSESDDAEATLVLMKQTDSGWRGAAIGFNLDCDALLEQGAPEDLCQWL